MTSGPRRVAALVAAGALVGAFGMTDRGPDRGADAAPVRVSRVLVVSLPYVTWADLERVATPNLDRLLGASSVGDLVNEVTDTVADLGDGYLRISAGARAFGHTTSEGEVFGHRERFGDQPAGDVFTQRTGIVVERGLVALGIGPIAEINADGDFDVTPGLLGDTLSGAGVGRAVIANADGADPDTPLGSESGFAYQRTAGLALMSSAGRIPSGRVGTALSTDDAHSPFGKRLDIAATTRAFAELWNRGGRKRVVLVEGSDLVRAVNYAAVTTLEQREHLFDAALRRSDRLVGALLDHVDTTTDAVLVVAPAALPETTTLTIASLHAPGVDPGLLRSGTTRRAGFVQVTDIAPTILDQLGVARPAAMTGRAMEVVEGPSAARGRAALLADEAEAAEFTAARRAGVEVALVVLGLAALALALVVGARRSKSRSPSTALRALALYLPAFLASTYLLGLVPIERTSGLAYWAALLGLAAVLTAVGHELGRVTRTDPLLLALGGLVVLLGVDTIVGTPLQFVTPLGPSPGTGGRFDGLTDGSWAVLGASALVVAPMLATRLGARLGGRVAVALLGACVLVTGLPFLGADLGGAVAMIPPFALVAVARAGTGVRRRLGMAFRGPAAAVVAVVVLAGAVAVALVAVDVALDGAHRSHVARLLERADAEGVSVLGTTVMRRLAAGARSFGDARLGILVPFALAGLGWCWITRRAQLRGLVARMPGGVTTAAALGLLGILGCVTQSGGIAVSGLVVVVALAVLGWDLGRDGAAFGVKHDSPGAAPGPGPAVSAAAR